MKIVKQDQFCWKFYLCFRLNAIHPDAYQAFQTSRDLKSVVCKLGLRQDSKDSNSDTEDEGDKPKTNISLNLMTPVLPMLVRDIEHFKYILDYIN